MGAAATAAKTVENITPTMPVPVDKPVEVEISSLWEEPCITGQLPGFDSFVNSGYCGTHGTSCFSGSGTIPSLDAIANQSGRISAPLDGSNRDNDYWCPDWRVTDQSLPLLKPGQVAEISNRSWFMKDMINRGAVVSCSLESYQSYQLVAQEQMKEERPLGICLQDVVSIDCTRQPLYFEDDTVNLGSKITILQRGQINSQVKGKVKAGDLVLAYDGEINTEQGYPIGYAITSSDKDGYAKIHLEIN